MTNTSDGLYHDAYKVANKSGINLLDFPLNTAMRDVFANDSGFQEIDSTLSQENANFTWQNDQVTFVDSQDLTRLLRRQQQYQPAERGARLSADHARHTGHLLR